MKIQILASDADLVRGALRDEPGAFEDLVLRHQRKAQAVALAIGVHPQSVEDVLQGSFLRAFRELRGLRDPGSFGSWLLAIVRNEAREHLRSAARAAFEALPEGVAPAPGESLEARDFREFLWRKVGELPEGVREAVFLYYHEGRSVRNVARTLEVSPSAVKNRLMAGRDLLRGRLWKEMERCFEGLLPARREWRRRGRRLALLAMMAVPGSLPGQAKAAASVSSLSGGFLSALTQGVLIMAAKKTSILAALLILGVLGGLMFLPPWFQGPGGAKSPAPDLARRAEESAGAPSIEQATAVKKKEVLRALLRAGIAGTVTFEESGAPAAGARVAALVDGEREFSATAVTDEKGRYEILDLAPRKYLVLAWKEAWATEGSQARDPVAVRADRLAEGIDRTLVPGVVITGVVVDEAGGSPIAGANVAANRLLFARSDPEGRFRIEGVPSGEAGVVAMAPGYARKRIATDVGPGDDPWLRVELEPGGIVEGRVAYAGGSPAVGVEVECIVDSLWIQIRSGPEGRYRLEGIPLRERAFPVYATRSPLFQTETKVEGFPEGQTRLEHDIVLEAGFVLEGKVLDREGRPVAGAEFYLDHWKWNAVGTSHEDGRFRIEGVNGSFQLLTARKKGFAPGSVKLHGLPPGDRSRLEIVLEPGRAISGTVVDVKGKPIEKAWVYVEESDFPAGPYPSTHTDRSGHFRFEDLLPEVKEVGALKGGYVGCRGHEPAAEAEEVHLVMEEAGQIRGEVVEAEGGAPVRNFTVKVKHSQRARNDVPLRSGLAASLSREGLQSNSSSGRFTLRQLAVGERFDLTVLAREYAEAVLRDVEALPLSEEGAFLRIELARGTEIRGRVVSDADGQPVPKLKVLYWSDVSMGGAGTILWDHHRLSDLGALRETSTDAKGGFRLTGPSTNAGTLFLEKRGFARTAIVPFVPSKGPLEIRLARGAVLEGAVKEASGDPVAGARVEVRFGDLVFPNASTGVDGRYQIDDLPAGEASVEVSDSGRVSSRGTVHLRPGERSVLDFRGATGSIVGRVTSKGEPLAGARVSLAGSRKDLGGANATADGEGIFHFENLTPGIYQIEAERAGVNRSFIAGAPRKVEVTGGETRADLAMAGGILAGRVVDRTTSQPVTGGEIYLHAYNPGNLEERRFFSVFGQWVPVESRKLPAGESSYRFEDLPPGKYFLTASRAPGKPACGWLGPVDLEPDRPAEDLTLSVGGSGSVEVEIAGIPDPSLKQATWVMIRSAGGEPFGVSSAPDAAGRIAFRDLPDGRYRLDAESDRMFSTGEDFEVAGQAVARYLRLEPAAWIRLALEGSGVEARAGIVMAVALKGDDPGWHFCAVEGNHPAEYGQRDPEAKDARYSFKTRPGRYRVRFEILHRDGFFSDPPLLAEEAEVILPPAGEAFVTLRIP